jgi:CarboxypepD_reg-like domain
MPAVRVIFFCFLFSFTGKMFAQSNIAGTVVNTANSPIPFAGVTLKAGAFEKNIQSDSAGKFTFNKLNNGTYLLHISHVGYNVYEYNFYLHQDTTFIVVLQPSGQQLSEVVVTGNKPVIERTADKIVYHVANSITAAGGDVLQAVSQLPGVKTNNNEISITGKGLVRVMINNRLLPLQGEDLTHYLKSLSANEISRIELLNNPPAKYEVEGNAGLINIITRHSKSQGYSGNVQLASKYYAPGVSSMYGVHSFGEINASANVAYNNNKWSVSGSVNHVRDRHLEGFETDVFYPQQSWLQTDTGLYSHNAFSVIAGVDYKLNAAATIVPQQAQGCFRRRTPSYIPLLLILQTQKPSNMMMFNNPF